MKSIREIIVASIVTLAVFSCVLYTSCQSKCGHVVCQNGGTCSDNVCICATGYYGSTCTNSETTEYLGTYKCNQSCNPAAVGAASWESSVVVSVNNGGYTVTINTFGGANLAIDATVDSLNNLDIIPGTYGISGRGIYYPATSTSTQPTINTNGQIVMHYQESTASGSGGLECTLTMNKE